MKWRPRCNLPIRTFIIIRNFGSWSYEGGHIVRGLWDLLTVFPSQELEECKHESISLRDRILQTLYWLFGNRILQISSLNITWKIFPHQTRLHEHLNHFLEDPHEFGFRILHNESLTYNDTSSVLPWLYSIGDNIGLFPIAFADRFVSFLFVLMAFDPKTGTGNPDRPLEVRRGSLGCSTSGRKVLPLYCLSIS